VTKELLEARFKELGFKEKLLAKLDEKHPRMLDSITKKDDLYLETLKTVIYNEIANNSCAIVGRGSNFILSNIPNVVKVRFVAPLEKRVANVATLLDISNKEAEILVKRSDRERAGFCYYYFGEIWNEAANYDLVINTEFFLLPDILDILEKTLATTAKTAQLNENIIADATLKQNVKFELFIKNDIEIKHRNIQCNNGCVTITGNVSSNAVKERVNNILEQLPQVKNIENNLTPILKDIAKRKE
jgi:cytidylate kinase